MTPAEQEQWEMDHILGLEVKVIQLQDQVNTMAATDQAAIHSLQTSLQNLQTQFANHSHTLTQYDPGHDCHASGQFWLTQYPSTQAQLTFLTIPGPCPGHPEYQGSTPARTYTEHVSLPVQGLN